MRCHPPLLPALLPAAPPIRCALGWLLETNRALSLVLGMPCVLAARLVNCRLSPPGVTPNGPCTTPALDRSPAPARTKLLLLTVPRPNSPARMLVTPFITRALRKLLTTFTLLT